MNVPSPLVDVKCKGSKSVTCAALLLKLCGFSDSGSTCRAPECPIRSVLAVMQFPGVLSPDPHNITAGPTCRAELDPDSFCDLVKTIGNEPLRCNGPPARAYLKRYLRGSAHPKAHSLQCSKRLGWFRVRTCAPVPVYAGMFEAIENYQCKRQGKRHGQSFALVPRRAYVAKPVVPQIVMGAFVHRKGNKHRVQRPRATATFRLRHGKHWNEWPKTGPT
jgi:hypothetical protein